MIKLQVFSLILFSVFSVSGQPASFVEIRSADPSFFEATNARGVAIADYDNDGDDDFFVSANPGKLFRNEGNFSFSEVAISSGISIACKLALWFDADNDGWLDLLVSGTNQLKLFHNNGNGRFSELSYTGFAGTSAQVALMAGDLNGDGWLDVYTNNFKTDNQLFINYGNNQFRNRIEGSGSEVNDQSMGGILFDFDRDRDLDLYITMDGYRPNRLFINDGTGHFQDNAPLHNLNIKTQGMGVDLADFNRDGFFDFYVSNLFDNSLLINNGDNQFTDLAPSAGVNDYGMGWGVVCLDYDNDALTDIYLNNEFSFSPFPNRLYKNLDGLSFADVASGTPLENKKSGIGCAASDFNNDGLVDLVVVNKSDQSIRIFKNEESNSNHWISFNLVGTTSNKFAAGAHVNIYAGGIKFREVITVGSGWYSQNSYQLHFGLGNALVVDSVEIDWADGNTDRYYSIPVDQRYLIVQNESIMGFSAESYRSALLKPNTLPELPEPEDQVIEIQPTFSIARVWNEALLEAIRNDFARPTVHARNLFHFSAAMYDAWACFEEGTPTFWLGKQSGTFSFPYSGFGFSEDKKQGQEEAISFAAYRLISHRFQYSPGASITMGMISKLMLTMGYEEDKTSLDYSTGEAYALGNYIASKVIEFGLQDGSNEENQYTNQFYQPLNPPMVPDRPGNPTCIDPNRWQPLKLNVFIDQSGNEIGTSPPFLSPEWGRVIPFALTENDRTIKKRDGHDWWVYHDPGKPPVLDTMNVTALSEEFKKSFLLVSIWSSHLDPADQVMMDISPASIGNIQEYPSQFINHLDFYNVMNGGDKGTGYALNPKTGLPYAQQFVPRGDYARVLAEFWADGPQSETPPGHWYTLLNNVSYHPSFTRKFKGEGEPLDPLEWDVKAYLALGGAMHDVAVSVWGIKGYYDYTRPISAIRYMADKGQSTNPALPNYHPAGLPLIPGYSELVNSDDPLSGESGEHIGKIKVKSWRGPKFILNPATDVAGVGWILAENWWPYQRPTFVTPPFAGYLSGHSSYSSAAAEVLTLITGDEFFPGGLAEYVARKNEYLVFEEGPSVDVRLQWARYKDAADQCSLSRIWGGIHPPIDDFHGRTIGKEIGNSAFRLAEKIFSGEYLNPLPVENEITVEVYPNPVLRNTYLTISSDHPISSVIILDMLGKEVGYVSNPEKQTNQAINLGFHQLQAGTYILLIRSDNKVMTKKFILL